MAPVIDFKESKERSFADVTQSDAGVDTMQFLEAARGVVRILRLDMTGRLALSPVATDLEGNIMKVETRFLATPGKSATLEELVRNEIAEGSKTATQGLLWLNRGLLFTSGALNLCQKDPNLKLSEAFTTSYGNTLKPHHTFFIKAIFSAAMIGCPKREDLYVKLKENKQGEDATQEYLDEKLNIWLAALDQIAGRIDNFFEVNGYKKGL